MPRLSLAAFFFAAAFLPASALAQHDAKRVWKSIESEHFIVTYYEPEGDVARRVAVVAERAHRVLSPALKHAPEEKTQIIITDDTDGSNGFASVVPRNQINLYAAAPDALSTLNDHDDWLYGLVAHEYSHILHLDTIEGLPYAYNKIFGKIWAPNNIQPRWFIEGLAVYEESKRSSSGRNRSAIFDTYLRGAILNHKTLNLDALSSGPYFWPHGNAVYLYGSHFLQYLGDRYGDDVIAKISHEYAIQPIPFGINRAAQRVIGKDYPALYEDWVAYLTRRFALQKAEVLRRGFYEGTKLTNTGEYNSDPHFTPDGKFILWQQSDGYSDPIYRLMPASGDYSKVQDIALFHGGGNFSFLPSGTGIIVERGMTYRSYYDFTDLYRLDFPTDPKDVDGYRTTRLTHGARTQGPDVSPDGKWIACGIQGGSRQKLALLPVNISGTGETEADYAHPQVLWEGGKWDQAYNPAWAPDGKSIVFSTWTDGGYDDLVSYDLATKQTTPLTHDRAIDVMPRFLPGTNGRVVLFSSDRTGIYNIFALDRVTGEMKQITNTLGGAFNFDVSSDGKKLVYSGFDDDGYELYLVDLDPSRWLPAEIYVDDRPDPTKIPDDEVPVTTPRPYRALETLGPLTWTANMTTDSYGSAITASTNGTDVAGLHNWFLSGTYGFTRADSSFGASYSYNGWFPSLGLSAAHSTGRFGGLIINDRNHAYTGEVYSLSASMGIPVLRLPELYSDLSISWGLNWLRDVDGPIPQNPNAPVPQLPQTGLTGGVTFSWYMSDQRSFTFSLGPVAGKGISVTTHLEHPDIGSIHKIVQVFLRIDQYWEMPWLHHVLAMRLNAGIQETDQANAGGFSLGGVPSQDIIQAIINSTRQATTWLHGYAPGAVSGQEYELINFEYRVPLLIIEKGISTLPVYFRRVHFAALLDLANATNGAFDPRDFKVSVGGSLRLDMTFGWYVGGAFDLGVSRGLSKGGDTEWWLLLTNSL